MRKSIRLIVFAALNCMLTMFVSPNFLSAEDVPIEEWTKNFAELGYYRANDMIIDDYGNAYITGSKYLYSPSREIVLTTKINSEGNVEWISETPHDYSCSKMRGNRVIKDSSGNIYVAGYIFCDTEDMLLIKYSQSGEIKWISKYSSPKYSYSPTPEDTVESMDVDKFGNVYLTGRTVNYIFWYSSLIAVTVKFDSNGNFQWVKNWTDHNGRGRVIKVGLDGNINVLAYIQSSYEIGWILIKYDQAGNTLMTTKSIIGGMPNDLIEDSLGNLYAAGYSILSNNDNASTVIKYDLSGNVIWLKQYNLSEGDNDIINSIAINNSDGALYTTGTARKSNTNSPYLWAITSRTNSVGDLVWSSPKYVDLASEGVDMHLDSNENIYVAINGGGGGTGWNEVVKYDQSGKQLWHLHRILPSSYTYGNITSLQIGDNDNNIYVSTTLMLGKYKQANKPPTANARNDQTIECSGPNGSQVTLNGSGSSDPDQDQLTYTWTWDGGRATGVSPVITLPLGTKTITLKVEDGKGGADEDTVVISIQDTTPPASSLQSITGIPGINGWYTSDVAVNLSANDTCSGVKDIHFIIDGDEKIVAGSASSFTVSAEGIHNVSYYAVDNAGNAETSHTLMLKIDKTPPIVSISVNPGLLWPPNHKMVTVVPAVSVIDNNDGSVVQLVSVTSNEPDNGLGDGDTAGDIVINADGTISLRAERSGKGSGRIYTVIYKATDVAGNETTASTAIIVPHNK